jgi:hypothetical protein
MRLQRLWLWLPTVVLSAADGFMTLAGQPAAYWEGDFAIVDELNPLAAWFLSLHPLAFAASGVPYLLLVAALIVRLPRPWSAAVAVVIAATHALGVVLWSLILFQEPWFALVIIGFGVVGLAGVAWQRGWRDGVQARV